MGSVDVTRDNKHGKKKRQIVISGGVGGLVVLGGAMAVTVLMVIANVFSGKQTSEKDVNLKKVDEELECGCSSEDDAMVGQRQRFQDDQHSKSIHQDSCCRRCGRSKISTNHEDKLTSEGQTYDHQEIFVLSDDSRPEVVTYGDENGTLAEQSPDTSISDNPYFDGEKWDRSESLMSKKIIELNPVADNERSSETNSTLRKRQGMTVKKDEIVSEPEFNGCSGRAGSDNTTGLKILNKEIIKKSMVLSPNNPVGLRFQIFFMLLLSIPFLILFLTYTAAFYFDNHSSIAIP